VIASALISRTGPRPVPGEVYVGVGSPAGGRLGEAVCPNPIIEGMSERTGCGYRWIHRMGHKDQVAMIFTNRRGSHEGKWRDKVG